MKETKIRIAAVVIAVVVGLLMKIGIGNDLRAIYGEISGQRTGYYEMLTGE